MTRHFLNYESALHSISESTKQTCNHFTILHYLTNRYLNLYFKYTGDIYEIEYGNYSPYDFDEDDFVIKSTNSLTDVYLRVNLKYINDSELYNVFSSEEHSITVHEVLVDKLLTNHRLAIKGTNLVHDPSTTKDLESFFKFMDEPLPFESYNLKQSEMIDLSKINHEINLSKTQLFFCSSEIEGLTSPSANKRAMNTYNRNNLSLQNKLLVQYLDMKLDEVNKDKRKLTINDRATIIQNSMTKLGCSIEWSVVREQLKDPSRLIKERML